MLKETLKQLLSAAVKPDGNVDELYLAFSQVLYTGRNGKQVKRIFLRTEAGICSFIFKPLTNLDTMGREVWLYEHLLPALSIRYPQLLATSDTDDPERAWFIYEDLGELQHHVDPKTLIAAARAIPLWHNLPQDSLPAGFKGHTPPIHEIIEQLRAAEQEIAEICADHHLPGGLVSSLLQKLSPPVQQLFNAKVVSHGDYYPSNFTQIDGELVVLDWEYLHRNSVYWDLFNLMDLTSPRYRKPTIEESLRNQILQEYYQANSTLPAGGFFHFQTGYRLYAALYSLWVLWLIEHDLGAGRFERDSLLSQRGETLQVLRECSST